jgi:hypothetical protein
MSEETLFQSTEVLESVDDIKLPPTDEDLIEKEFESGVNQSLNIEETPEETVGITITQKDFDELKAKAARVDEIDAKFQKSLDSAYGSLGGKLDIFEQRLQSIQAPPAAAPVPLTKESFTALAEYLDGDDALIEAMVKDFSNLPLGGAAAQTPVDYDAVNAAIAETVTERVDQIAKEFEIKLLTLQHPDWRKVRASEEFTAWEKTLTPEDNELLNNSWDGLKLIEAFNQFKSYQAKKEELAQRKQQLLEDNIPIQGGGSRTSQQMTDPFNEGLRKVLNGT